MHPSVQTWQSVNEGESEAEQRPLSFGKDAHTKWSA
jgi:hypothetical protein